MPEIVVEHERVISKSSVWPEECVGNVTCCVREKTSRRLRKEDEKEQLGWSTWTLKSPVIISSDRDVAKSSRREENSEGKSYLKHEGGR